LQNHLNKDFRVNKVIGVGDERALPQLKRWLLLDDQIAIVDKYEKDWSFRSKKPSLAADLDWLTERGIVFSVNNCLNWTNNVKEVRQEGDKVLLILQSGGPASMYIQPIRRANGKPMTVGN
jgi:hypothetical protein